MGHAPPKQETLHAICLGNYLLFEAGDDHKLLDNAVIETKVLPAPPPQNWDPTSPYHNLCQVFTYRTYLYDAQLHAPSYCWDVI